MTKYAAAESTKQKLVDAAGELVAEKGLDNVSTRAVAEASGENIGSIHYHFGGKGGLFETVAHEAIRGCVEQDFYEIIEALDASATPQELADVIRIMVSGAITDLFRSDRPIWHAQVIYQLLQRDDALYEIFRTKLLDPNMDAMGRFFKLVDPAITPDEAVMHTTAIQMPIFAHANYMKALLKRLGRDCYSEDYLQKLEDLLVKQTQLVLGLPVV